MRLELIRAALAARPQRADHFAEDPWPPRWRRHTPAQPRRWPPIVRVIILLAQVTAVYAATLAGFCAGLAVRIMVWG
jgi:hypothetical protein